MCCFLPPLNGEVLRLYKFDIKVIYLHAGVPIFSSRHICSRVCVFCSVDWRGNVLYFMMGGWRKENTGVASVDFRK